MSIIQTINKNSWILLVVVGIAMAAFILGDFLGNRANMFQDEQSVGTIAGEPVSYQEYQAAVENEKRAYIINTRQQPNEQVTRQLREQAWRRIIARRAYQPEFEKLGLEVSDDEISDMIIGDNLHPSLVQSFTDPSTGQFNRQALARFVADDNNLATIQNFENQLRPERINTKYSNLLQKTRFVTEEEAKAEYIRQTQTASIQYMYVPYSAIPDSSVNVTDSDMRAYYNDHMDDFEQVEGRSIKFVKVPVAATVGDKQQLFKELGKDGRSLQGTNNLSTDSTFIEARSDAPNPIQSYTAKTLPNVLKNETLEVGKVYGPYDEGAQLTIYKYLTNTIDSSSWSAKASHILFKIDAGEDSATVKAEATRVLRRANTRNFSDLAAQYSEDASNKNKGGSLGTFNQGDMVPAFNDAVANATRTGVLNRLVKTRFGYHIINVEELPKFDKMVIGRLSRDLLPSDGTIDQAYTRIGRFTRYKTQSELDAAVEADSSLSYITAPNINPNQSRMINVTTSSARDLVLWLYDIDRKQGDVSDVFRYDDANIIAVVTDIKEKGSSPFDNVKDQLRQIVLKEKKQEVILTKMSGLSGATLAEKKAAYGEGAQLEVEEGLTFASYSIAGVGAAPKTIGTAFGLAAGSISEPVIDENAITLVRLDSKSEPVETADYTIYKNQLEQKGANGISFKINQAISEQYEVEDNRYRYF